MLHRSSWNAGSFGEEPLRIGRCTVRLKRSLGEGGFAFVHLVEACPKFECFCTVFLFVVLPYRLVLYY